jgi:diphosphoinositol-polyphosphate diphosphatase
VPLSPVTSPLVSRTGRERQRFAGEADAKIRLVAGSIPTRRAESGAWEVLMVTNKHKDSLIFPKGGWETDETAEEAAARESMEEAGVVGRLTPLDEFAFESKMKGGVKTPCKCSVFVMRVTEVMEVWPEGDARSRAWYAPEEAIRNCKHPWMRDAMRAWGRAEGLDLADGWTGARVALPGK